MNSKEVASTSGLKTMQLNDQKAGMQGLDKEMINKIIFEASKGTPYFTFQEKRQKSIDSKVKELYDNLKKITDAQRKDSLEKMSALGAALEAERDLTHLIVHIDMDAFYAAVEMLDNPKLKEKPMAVGSLSMLSTSNYHARKYGVRAAMPGFIAKKLCPELIIVPCNFEKYCNMSKKVRNILKLYDPDFSTAGLDEAYLDLTTYVVNQYKKQRHLEQCVRNCLSDAFSDEEDQQSPVNFESCFMCCQPISNEKRDQMAYNIVEEIRNKIFNETHLTASAGLAPNTMLAKVCSDQNKPNGQYQIKSTVDAVKSFISTLLVKKISGIGPVQGQILNAIGIHTCSDMWEKRDIVGNLFTPISVDFYLRVSLGIGSTAVKSDYIRKSIGVEHTFKDTHERDELHKKCMELCEEMIEDLKAHKMLGKVVVLKIKTSNFETHTRNHSLAYHSDDKEIICKAAKKLLDTEISSVAPQLLTLRLMGIRMANLLPEGEVPDNEKQPAKLTDFLHARTIKISQIFTCPICHKDFKTSASLFNDHVNNCLNESCNAIPAEQCNGSSVLHTDVPENDSKKESNTVIQNNSSTNEMPRSFSCPVCGFDQNVNNLIELNMHIDSCLNRVAIKEILSSDLTKNVKRKMQGKEMKNYEQSNDGRKIRKIDDYFR